MTEPLRRYEVRGNEVFDTVEDLTLCCTAEEDTKLIVDALNWYNALGGEPFHGTNFDPYFIVADDEPSPIEDHKAIMDAEGTILGYIHKDAAQLVTEMINKCCRKD